MSQMSRMFVVCSCLMGLFSVLHGDLLNPHAAVNATSSSSGSCVGITNANSAIFVLAGYDSGGAFCSNGCNDPVVGQSCYSSLVPQGQQAVYIPETDWLYLQYSVCSGVSYDNAGNAICQGFMGDVGLSFSGSSVEVANADGGTVSIGTISSGYYPVTFTPSAPKTYGIENDTAYSFVFTSSTSDSASCSDSCYQTLPPNAQQFVSVSPSGYINLQYDVCNSVSYSDEGIAFCASCDFLGNFGVTSTDTGFSVSNNDQGVPTLNNASNPTLYNVTYAPSSVPCPLGSMIPTPQTYGSNNIPYRGVNLLGCEYQNFSLPCACNAVYFAQQGVNTIRLPVCWEYLQGNTPLGTGIDFSQGDALSYTTLVNSFTAAGLTVIIDMHNYMRYNASSPATYIDSADYIIGSTDPSLQNGPSAAEYGIAWGSIATEFATNANVIFALMNEPNNMTTELIISNYNAAIPYIRNAEAAASGGLTHLLILQGNAYSCMGDWEKNYYGTSNSVAFATGNSEGIIDSQNYWAVDVHQYFNGSGSVLSCGNGSTECIDPSTMLTNENFTEFLTWLQTNQQRALVSELGGLATSNCVGCIVNYLTAVQTYPATLTNPGSGTGGFIGWTGWGASPFESNYILNLGPTYEGGVQTESYQFENGFQPFLTPL